MDKSHTAVEHGCDAFHTAEQSCSAVFWVIVNGDPAKGFNPFNCFNDGRWPLLLMSTDPFQPFIIFSNRHEIRHINLNKGEYSVLVPGLRNTIALDFHLSQSALYWTDVVEDKIYRGKLSENGGEPL